MHIQLVSAVRSVKNTGPSDAIHVIGFHAVIDRKKCIACGYVRDQMSARCASMMRTVSYSRFLNIIAATCKFALARIQKVSVQPAQSRALENDADSKEKEKLMVRSI